MARCSGRRRKHGLRSPRRGVGSCFSGPEGPGARGYVAGLRADCGSGVGAAEGGSNSIGLKKRPRFASSRLSSPSSQVWRPGLRKSHTSIRSTFPLISPETCQRNATRGLAHYMMAAFWSVTRTFSGSRVRPEWKGPEAFRRHPVSSPQFLLFFFCSS